MDDAYRCIRTLKITGMLISKTKDHICKTISLWRELKLSVTLSTHLFEDHVFYQIENIIGGLADKSEDPIERTHQDGKRSERIYCGLTNFKQSQVSQLKHNDITTNPQIKVKSE